MNWVGIWTKSWHNYLKISNNNWINQLLVEVIFNGYKFNYKQCIQSGSEL